MDDSKPFQPTLVEAKELIISDQLQGSHDIVHPYAIEEKLHYTESCTT